MSFGAAAVLEEAECESVDASGGVISGHVASVSLFYSWFVCSVSLFIIPTFCSVGFLVFVFTWFLEIARVCS